MKKKIEKQQYYEAIGRLIRRLRGERTIVSVARELGITEKRVQNWEKGRGLPRPPLLGELAKALGTTETELLQPDQFDDASRQKNETRLTQDLAKFGNVVRVPVISWVAASEWCAAEDPFPVGYAEEYELVVDVSEDCFALKVEGPSMEPEFAAGSIIVLDPHRAPVNGCYVVAKRADSDQATFKQYFQEGGRVYLKPLNPQFPVLELGEDGHICGVLVRHIRKF